MIDAPELRLFLEATGRTVSKNSPELRLLALMSARVASKQRGQGILVGSCCALTSLLWELIDACNCVLRAHDAVCHPTSVPFFPGLTSEQCVVLQTEYARVQVAEYALVCRLANQLAAQAIEVMQHLEAQGWRPTQQE